MVPQDVQWDYNYALALGRELKVEKAFEDDFLVRYKGSYPNAEK